jgi:geranylgeranyl pyrophosphate synthase
VRALDEWLRTYPQRFDERVFPIVKTILSRESTRFPEEVKQTLNLVARGGKRIRSAIYSYCCADSDSEGTLRVEGLIELFHVALLIHDDWVDQADVRRKGPSFHKALEDSGRALMWGDYLFSFVIREFWVLGNEWAGVLSDVFQSTCQGQMMDLALRDGGSQLGSRLDAEYFHACYGAKTGWYGFYFPMAIAWLSWHPVASLPPWIREGCARLGTVYQILDDLLILEDGPGKSVETDFVNQQLTYPLWVMQNVSGEIAYPPSGAKVDFVSWRRRMKTTFDRYSVKGVLLAEVRRLLEFHGMEGASVRPYQTFVALMEDFRQDFLSQLETRLT